jgi:hypothetical protein
MAFAQNRYSSTQTSHYDRKPNENAQCATEDYLGETLGGSHQTAVYPYVPASLLQIRWQGITGPEDADNVHDD